MLDMINNEFETTYYSENPKEWLMTLNGLIDLFIDKGDNERFYQFNNFVYFLIDLGNDENKEKIVFKLDDSHILFRSSKKHLSLSEIPDVQYYLEEKEKWRPLSAFDLSKIREIPFYVYYKEKVVYKVCKDCTNFSFIADNVFFMNFNNLEVVKNIKYIEIEADDIRVLKTTQKLFDDYIGNNSDFCNITDSFSKYNICKQNSLQWQGKISSMYELENLINRIFTALYLYSAESI